MGCGPSKDKKPEPGKPTRGRGGRGTTDSDLGDDTKSAKIIIMGN